MSPSDAARAWRGGTGEEGEVGRFLKAISFGSESLELDEVVRRCVGAPSLGRASAVSSEAVVESSVRARPRVCGGSPGDEASWCCSARGPSSPFSRRPLAGPSSMNAVCRLLPMGQHSHQSPIARGWVFCGHTAAGFAVRASLKEDIGTTVGVLHVFFNRRPPRRRRG